MQAQENKRDLARARLYHRLSVAAAIVVFAALVVGFGMQWKPWFQAPVILAAWIAVEWQRRCLQKVKALTYFEGSKGSARTG